MRRRDNLRRFDWVDAVAIPVLVVAVGVVLGLLTGCAQVEHVYINTAVGEGCYAKRGTQLAAQGEGSAAPIDAAASMARLLSSEVGCGPQGQ